MGADFDVDQALDDAVASHKAGHLDLAERGYRNVLDAAPDDPDALNFLGVLLQDAGDYAASEQCLQRAVRQVPDFAEALTNLARVQQITGQAAAAATSASAAIASDPDLGEAYQQLARALLDLGDYQAAEAALQHAIGLHPDDSDLRILLGTTLLGLGKTTEAKQSYDLALQQQSGHIDTVSQIAAAWLGAKRPREAAELYARAIETDPNSAIAHAGIAFAHRAQERPALAVEASERALALAPERADVWLLLGQSLAHLGQFDRAALSIRRALALDPKSINARRDLAMIGCLAAGDADAANLWTTLRDDAAPRKDRITAAFGLGAALDRAADYDSAFDVYSLANQMVHADRLMAGRGFSPQALHHAVDWLITTFAPGSFTAPAAIGDQSDQLVFVVGMPRTGTTLVEQIAASHPDVFGAGEQTMVGGLVDRLNGGSKTTTPATWNEKDARTAAQQAIDQLQAVANGAGRIIDKMPDNLFLLGHIARLFPQARVILCTRDPRDVCLSAYFQQFGGDISWCYDLADCAEQAHEVARLMAHWRQVLPLRMLEIDYESLVSDLEGQSRRLIEFLDLEWHPACLEFHQTDRPVMTASFWQVRQPLYATSVGRWKHYRRQLVGLNFALLGLTPAPEQEDWTHLLADAPLAVAVAKAHHRAGRLDAAEQIYDAMLARNPLDAAVLHLRGIACLNRDRFSDAIALFLRSRDVEPGNARLSADLARAYHAAHDDAAAAASARVAIEQDPSLSDAWCQLGYALVELSDGPGAVAAMREACRLSPDGREAIIGLATILFRQKQYHESEALWREASERFPGDGDILLGLSRVLTEQGRHTDSLDVCLEAVNWSQKSASSLFQLGWVYMRGQNVSKSIDTLNAALQVDDKLVDGWLLLAYGHSMMGNHQAATKCYRTVLSLHPDNGEALIGLVKIRRHETADGVVAASARIIDDPTSSMNNRIAAAFTWAQEAETLGDHDASFRAFQTANDLLRASRVASDPDQTLAELRQIVDASISIFSRNVVSVLSGVGLKSDAPVFIVGLPRSGTTLVEQIAASHPAVCGLGERGDFLELLGAETRSMLLTPPAGWDLGQVRSASEAFLRRLDEEGGNASRIINKLPNNILWLGHITALFPNARIIVCRRDLRDVGWSCYSQYFFDDGMAWTDTLAGCAAQAREIERLLDHWTQVLPGRFLEVYYEDVIEDIDREARRLIDYLGLVWDPACLSFHKTERVVMTASHWQVRQPLYSTSVGRWRNYRKHLSPLLDALKGLVPEDD